MNTITKTSHIVFRNPKNMIWYLQRRPNQPKAESSYSLGPNDTVEALDTAEEMLLASMGLIDVEKETPVLADNMAALRAELETERAKNAALLAQNEALKATPRKVETTTQAPRNR